MSSKRKHHCGDEVLKKKLVTTRQRAADDAKKWDRPSFVGSAASLIQGLNAQCEALMREVQTLHEQQQNDAAAVSAAHGRGLINGLLAHGGEGDVQDLTGDPNAKEEIGNGEDLPHGIIINNANHSHSYQPQWCVRHGQACLTPDCPSCRSHRWGSPDKILREERLRCM